MAGDSRQKLREMTKVICQEKTYLSGPSALEANDVQYKVAGAHVQIMPRRSRGCCCGGLVSVSARARMHADGLARTRGMDDHTHERPHFRIKWRSTD